MDTLSTWIRAIYRVAPAICKHIASKDALAGGGVAVRVDESAEGGIVIPALQIIQSQLLNGAVAVRSKKQHFLRVFSAVGRGPDPGS